MADGWALHRDDCLSVLPGIATGSVELVCADPPYNAGVAYETYSDSLPPDAYGLWCGAWFAECRRIAKRWVVVFPGHRHLGMWFQLSPSGVGCWHKPGSPKGGGSFRWCEWEPVLYWSRGGAWCGFSDTISVPLVSHGQKDTGDVPCPKPPKLYRELLKRLKPTSVLDPMMGSGNLGVECVKAGISFTGIELAPGYYATAKARIEAAAGQGKHQLTSVVRDVPDLFAGVT